MVFVRMLRIALIVSAFHFKSNTPYSCHSAKASEATRGQALDHQNHDTYIKYQSVLKSLDVQALVYELEPDNEGRNMEQSMAHHRDPNAPIKLNTASIDAFENTDKIKIINKY